MEAEFEVYSPVFESILEPIVCRTITDAYAVCNKLDDLGVKRAGEMGLFALPTLWAVRQVEKGKREIPPQAGVVTPILVDELRKLMAKHGHDMLVSVAWSARDNNVNIATAGSCPQFSEDAFQLGQRIALALGCDPKDMQLCEDRREDHELRPPT